MKLIITEDKLYKTFSNFMDKYFDLKYDTITRIYMGVEMTEDVFIDKDGESFGRAFDNESFLLNYNKKLMIKSFFGDNTDELLLQYLNNKFGDDVWVKRIV